MLNNTTRKQHTKFRVLQNKWWRCLQQTHCSGKENMRESTNESKDLRDISNKCRFCLTVNSNKLLLKKTAYETDKIEMWTREANRESLLICKCGDSTAVLFFKGSCLLEIHIKYTHLKQHEDLDLLQNYRLKQGGRIGWEYEWNKISHELLLLKPDNGHVRWHPIPVLLPGKSHGRRGLVGCRPWGR